MIWSSCNEKSFVPLRRLAGAAAISSLSRRPMGSEEQAE